jgi:hypothetical protein
MRAHCTLVFDDVAPGEVRGSGKPLRLKVRLDPPGSKAWYTGRPLTSSFGLGAPMNMIAP